jgi:hypothetical protein
LSVWNADTNAIHPITHHELAAEAAVRLPARTHQVEHFIFHRRDGRNLLQPCLIDEHMTRGARQISPAVTFDSGDPGVTGGLHHTGAHRALHYMFASIMRYEYQSWHRILPFGFIRLVRISREKIRCCIA